MDGGWFTTAPARPEWRRRLLLAALILALLGGFGYWLAGRMRGPAQPRVVMRDMSYGVAMRPGETADTPELVVDPFPDDPPSVTAEPLPAQTAPAAPADVQGAEHAETRAASADGFVAGREITPQAGWQQPKGNVFRVDRHGNVANAAELGKYLQGTERSTLGEPPTFLVNASGPCRLSVKIAKVNAWKGARLEFVLDGQVVPMVTLSPRPENDARVGKVFDLDMPRGQHRIMVRNVGKDWASVEWYKFSGYLAE